MSYQQVCCPKCGNELMPKDHVREITRKTYETDSVGTAICLTTCGKCTETWGFVIASDRKSWTIIPVHPEQLQMLHEAIRNLIRLGTPVAEIAQRIEKELLEGKTRDPSDTAFH